jgi:RNA polymerase sigma-70 factor (ECF subfamily)
VRVESVIRSTIGGIHRLQGPPVADGSRSFDPVEAPDLSRVAALYREHHAFVWRVLRRCGVPEADLDDAVQDTFLVLVRRLDDFDGRAAITTWLYAVAVRVASTRRRSHTREDARRRNAGAGVHATRAIDPEAELSRVEAARVLDDLLEELDDSKRTVFVLADLEGVRVPEISRILGVNVRTIHSRLRLARERFGAALERRHARDDGRARRARWTVQRLAAAADERPAPARRKAVAAALIADIGRGTSPALPGWQALTIAAPTPLLVPVAVTLAIAGAVLGVGAFAAAPRQRPGAQADHERAPTRASEPVRSEATPSVPASDLSDPDPDTAPEAGKVLVAPRPAVQTQDADASPSRPRPRKTTSTLAEETELLEAARTALARGEADAALRALDRHADRFPTGELADEARSTRLRALCRAGRADDARALADTLAPAGGSRWHAIVDASCGA